MSDAPDDERYGPEAAYDEVVDADGEPIPGLDVDDELPSVADLLRGRVHDR